MADITRLGYINHLRADASRFIIRYRSGNARASGAGLAFWFQPLNTALVEIPIDNRELPFHFHARSRDYQDVTVQGVINLRIDEPEKLAERIDFSIDSGTGLYIEAPLDKLAALVTELAQQFTSDYLLQQTLPEILEGGLEVIRLRIENGLRDDLGIADLGLGISSVRVVSVRPDSEVEKALQTPAREELQQAADEATFERRALAVEKERAIQENELKNQIELARREEELIRQRGENERTRVTDEAQAKGIETEAKAERSKLLAGAEAERITVTEGARSTAESDRMAIYRDYPTETLVALSLEKLAGNLPAIEHLTLTPDFVGDYLNRLVGPGDSPDRLA
jgi:regulator of protease activity HflC (stomatin/prohibitin superfamily)